MSNLALRRREALGLVAFGASTAGCLGVLEEDGSRTADDPSSDGSNRIWPTPTGSVANDWRNASAAPPTDWLASVEEWTVGDTATAVASGETIVLAGDSLVALDGAFEERWRRDPDGETGGWEACALGDGRLYAWGSDGTLRAFDPDSGEADWREAFGAPHGRLFPTEDALYVVAAASPTEWPDPEARVLALDPASGAQQWTESIHGAASAGVGEERLVVAAHDEIVALDRGSGAEDWRVEPEGTVTVPPTVVGDGVVFASRIDYFGGRKLYELAPSNGDVRWREPATDVSNQVVLDDRVIAVDARGLLVVDRSAGELRVVADDVDPGMLAAGHDALFVLESSVRGARSPDGQWTDGPELETRPFQGAVLDDGLLVGRQDGVVERFALDPTVRDVFGIERLPAGDRLALVAPDGGPRLTPDTLDLQAGTTVRFGWATDGATLDVVDQPEESEWSPAGDSRDRGDVLDHAFSVPGHYGIVVGIGGREARGSIEVGALGVPRRVDVGPGGEFVFEPAALQVEPGTTVVWDWKSDDHNVVPTSIPDGATWEGHPEIANAGTTDRHTFEVAGTYEYHCEPHGPGMEATIVVRAE